MKNPYPYTRDPKIGETEDGKPIYRISSTSLTNFLECESLAVLGSYYPGIDSSEAMDFGTMFHAVLEYRLEHGVFPTKKQVMRMSGTYEALKVVFIRSPGEWLRAEQAAHNSFEWAKGFLGDPPVDEDHRILEYDLDALGEYACDGRLLLGGSIDILDNHTQTVRDWKTRSSFSYIPKTKEEFRNNPQLMYYAARAARKFNWQGEVTFQHLNAIRPKPDQKYSTKNRLVSHPFDRRELDLTMEWLEGDIFPRYVAALDTLYGSDYTQIKHIARDDSKCWRYNKQCKYSDQCNAANNEGMTILEQLQRANKRVAVAAEKKATKNKSSPHTKKKVKP